MEVINKIIELKKIISELSGRSIGFVPTMGFLHKGHESLIRESLNDNDVTIVSIFVNPTQFGENEDFDDYPRDFKKDYKILNGLGVQILFNPDNREIYPPGFCSSVKVEKLDEKLCGKSRPGHFTGVTTIVLKLLNIVSPDTIYLGKKDAQQLIIVKKMVDDLNINVNVKGVDIVRGEDGLALSSRNSYLSEKGRKAALVLSKAFRMAKNEICKNNILNTFFLKKMMVEFIRKEKSVKIDYIEIVSLDKLEDLKEVDKSNTLVAGAIFVENVRLIDNFILGEL